MRTLELCTRGNNMSGAAAELAQRPPRLALGRVNIDCYDECDLIQEILGHAKRGTSTRQIATVNAQFYVLAEKCPEFRACLERAEYVCADGMSIVWACRALLAAKVPRIAGVDLVSNLCEAGAAQGLRVFLLGGRPGTASESARILESKYPGLVIAGTLCPEYGFETREAELEVVLTTLHKAKPDVVFLALGAPKQELFISRYVRPLQIPLAVGVGGSFEMISGVVERAPSWMQASGLEWCHRLSQEPHRLLRRYLVGNAEFLFHLVKWSLSRTWNAGLSLSASANFQLSASTDAPARSQ